MFKKRTKKNEAKKMSSLIDDNPDLQNIEKENQVQQIDNVDFDTNYIELSRLEKLQQENKQIMTDRRIIGGNTNSVEAAIIMDSFKQEADSKRDLNEYIEKRIVEIEGSELSKLRNQQESDKYDLIGQDSKLDELMNLAQNRDEPQCLEKRDDSEFDEESDINSDEEFDKLNNLEKLGRKIREENKDSAFWSTGLIEVDIGQEKKTENFESNEVNKREKILNDITMASIPDYFEVKDEEDLSEWMYRPKDKSRHAKETKQKERKQFNQAFKKEGRHYARENRMKTLYQESLEDVSVGKIQPKNNLPTVINTNLEKNEIKASFRKPIKLKDMNLKLQAESNNIDYES